MTPSSNISNPTQTLQQKYADAVSALNKINEPWPALTTLVGASLPSHPPTKLPSSTTNENPADEVIQLFKNLSAIVHRAALISSNEHLDEIPTRHIKYIILPFLTAQAYKSWQGENETRLEHLFTSQQELNTFLTSCENLRLLSEDESDRFLNNSPDAILSLTPAQKREEKIARFKAEKAAQKKLEILLERIHQYKQENDDDDEDEDEREATLIILQSAVRKALDFYSSLEQEIEILRYAQKMRSKGIDPSQYAQNIRPKGPPPGMNGMPSTFRIISSREEEKKAVFRPSHSLPTYTIEEWGEIEAKRLAEQTQKEKEKEIAAKRRKDEEDSDGDDAVDRATMEARGWDNWKDDHNSGSGNTIR